MRVAKKKTALILLTTLTTFLLLPYTLAYFFSQSLSRRLSFSIRSSSSCGGGGDGGGGGGGRTCILGGNDRTYYFTPHISSLSPPPANTFRTILSYSTIDSSNTAFRYDETAKKNELYSLGLKPYIQSKRTRRRSSSSIPSNNEAVDSSSLLPSDTTPTLVCDDDTAKNEPYSLGLKPYIQSNRRMSIHSNNNKAIFDSSSSSSLQQSVKKSKHRTFDNNTRDDNNDFESVASPLLSTFEQLPLLLGHDNNNNKNKSSNNNTLNHSHSSFTTITEARSGGDLLHLKKHEIDDRRKLLNESTQHRWVSASSPNSNRSSSSHSHRGGGGEIEIVVGPLWNASTTHTRPRPRRPGYPPKRIIEKTPPVVSVAKSSNGSSRIQPPPPTTPTPTTTTTTNRSASAAAAGGGGSYDDLLTLQDLEVILSSKRFLQQSDLDRLISSLQSNLEWSQSVAATNNHTTTTDGSSSSTRNDDSNAKQRSFTAIGAPFPKLPGKRSGSSTSSSSSNHHRRGRRIAFPQPLKMDATTLQYSCSAAASLTSMMVATSLIPNLWLAGALVGALYGNEVGQRATQPPPPPQVQQDNMMIHHEEEEDHHNEWTAAAAATTTTTSGNVDYGPVDALVLYMGRRLARLYLTVYDAWNALFFMWKTGQLSYEYYQQYSRMDQRFAIQNKLDAWNSFFVQGKMAFDKWERDHEVGRKILAGLRTAWLVEERSLKKTSSLVLRRKRSKYRVLQWLYTAEYLFVRMIRSIWNVLTGGEGSNDFRDFIKGIRSDFTDAQASRWGVRFGGALAALVVFNLAGGLFAIAPSSLSILAILVGAAWPTWPSELVDRISLFVEETRVRGRDGLAKSRKYHYFVKEDGKKRYYRTGQPLFFNMALVETKKKKKNRNRASEGKWNWWPT